MGDEVHFLDSGDAAAGSEEMLDAGPRRLPRRRFGFAAVLGAALVAGLLVAHHGGQPHPIAAFSSAPTSGRASVLPPDVAAIAADPFGPANNSLVYGGGRLYGISDTRLGVISGRRRQVRSLSPSSAAQGRYQLLYDARAESVWVVPALGNESGRIREYDRRLRLMRTVRLSEIVYSAAVLDGTLYLSAAGRLLQLGPDATSARAVRLPRFVELSVEALGNVFADPARHRLLFLGYPDPAAPPSLMTWSPRSGRSRLVPLDGVEPSLAVVGGRIWVAGFRTYRAVLERLDPLTLRPVAMSPLAGRIGPGVLIVGSGAGSFLVRSGTDPAPLWCLDASHGRVRQQWSSPAGTVTGGGRRVWVATSLGLSVLRMHGCPG